MEWRSPLDPFVVACPFRKTGFHPSGQTRGHAFPGHALKAGASADAAGRGRGARLRLRGEPAEQAREDISPAAAPHLIRNRERLTANRIVVTLDRGVGH